ncbi:MAG: AAA family ATPase [Nanoarchaeota archaeon]|nr:AAA family ATPase [Nanoarchaeota archaeon]
MGVFDDVLKADQTLIKNDAALDYEFLPKILPFRDGEQKYIASCIAPLFRDTSGRNLMIHGPPGIGKTAATRHVLRELEEKTDNIESVFVNCWRTNTSHKIALDICDQVGFKFTQNMRTPDLYKKIAEIVNKRAGVFVFDEIDKAEDYDFLYTILESVYKKTIIIITNYKEFIIKLDERIKSRLMPEHREFGPYTEKQTGNILQERLKYAFFDNVWTEDAFNLVTEKAYSLKDIRQGIFLLKNSALVCEDKGQKKIQKEHVEEAIKKLSNFAVMGSDELDEDSQFILEIIKKNSGKKIGDLFKLYEQEGGKQSYKTFQRKLKRLDEGKYLSLTKETGAGGNTTIVNKKITDF